MRRGARKKSSPENRKYIPTPKRWETEVDSENSHVRTAPRWEGYAYTVLLGVFCVVAVLLFWKNPMPGLSVLGVAVVAAVMSLDQGMGRFRKASWLVLLGVFAMLEVRAISKDRTEQGQNFLRTLSTITGGDSYAFFSLKPLSESPTADNLIYPFLMQRGDNPLRDLKIKIVRQLIDNQGYSDILSLPPRDVAVGEKTQLMQYPLKLPAKKMMLFMIYYDALNGHWSEQVGLRVVGAKWREAIRVQRSTASDTTLQILYQYTDPDFPKINGQPDWYSPNSY